MNRCSVVELACLKRQSLKVGAYAELDSVMFSMDNKVGRAKRDDENVPETDSCKVLHREYMDGLRR